MKNGTLYRMHKTDLIAFMAGALVFLMLMHSEFIDGAVQELFTEDCSQYKNEEKSISGLNVLYLGICKELLKNR